MKNKITILVDEQQLGSPYIVIEDVAGKFRVLEKGQISEPERLRDVQLSYDESRVQIDSAFMWTPLEQAAQLYNWKLLKFKHSDFPFIEALLQLAR